MSHSATLLERHVWTEPLHIPPGHDPFHVHRSWPEEHGYVDPYADQRARMSAEAEAWCEKANVELPIRVTVAQRGNTLDDRRWVMEVSVDLHVGRRADAEPLTEGSWSWAPRWQHWWGVFTAMRAAERGQAYESVADAVYGE